MAERIAVTGSAGVGKSTLARRLAAELGVPYIAEGMREYLERTGDNLHDLGHAGMRSLVLRLWEERKEAEARATTGFVADRAGYDFGAFWLYYQFAAQDEDTERLLAETLAPGRYDGVFLLPWGRIPLAADGVRTPNPYTQLHFQCLLEGLLRRYDAEAIEIATLGVEERVVEVLTRRGLR
ncbi:MAG: ATP-binding protein [Pseudomonadota bacterium]|nr:ATP-binding protein [Pseudomonadota bacterium]